MNLRMTRKELQGNIVIIANDLHCLDQNNKIGYNSGYYGWNWDCYRYIYTNQYKIDQVVYIVKGYRSFPKGITATYEQCTKYDNIDDFLQDVLG